MAEVFDLGSAVPENEQEPFQFLWDGETFTCRDLNKLDIRRVSEELGSVDGAENVVEAATNVLKFLLGDEYERFDATESVFTMAHFGALSAAWAEHHGLDVPKSGG